MRTRHCLITPAILLATLAVAASAGNTIKNPGAAEVVPELKGLVFVDKTQDFRGEGVTKSGIDTSGVALLNTDNFSKQLRVYLGHPLTFDGLNAITHSVITYYRDHNHPLVDAVAPQQNVNNGVIQIVVTEFRVGQVLTRGNRWFSDAVVTAPITLQHGDTVDTLQLVNELDAANSNPFRRVNLVYQPSANPGYTDLVLDTQDRLPIRLFSGFDNSGTPITGRSRWEMGATWGNALWHDQQLSYQMSTSDNFFSGGSSGPGKPGGATFFGQMLTWSMPIHRRDSITVSGNYDRSVPNVGQDFGLVGKSWGVSARYNKALHRAGALTQTASLGYDFKSTNNNLAFGGTEVMRNNVQIDQLVTGYMASLTDRWGSTSVNTNLFYSPGDMSAENANAAFQPGVGQSGRALASARYTYWRTDLNRLTKLPAHLVWSARVIGQASTANLLYTEQLAGGGPDILRGYDPNSVLGDQGLIVSNELRSPSFHKGGEFSTGNLQLVGFWDWAHMRSVHEVDGAVNRLNASSAGMGLRYNLRSNLTTKLDYGFQLQHLPGANNRDRLLSLSLIASY